MASSSRPIRPSPAFALLALLLSANLAGAACGKQGAPPQRDTSPAGPDLSTPDAAIACVSRAVEAGDFAALRACSTIEGIEGVRRDLLAWSALLSDTATGTRIASRIPPPRDAPEDALYRAAFTGDLAGLFRMLTRSRASDSGPVARAEVVRVVEGVERVEIDRVQRDGTRRRVVLVWKDGAWRVARIAL